MRIEFHEIIDSTQRRARELIERGDRRWDAVCAGHQTAGRGRQGARWHDAPGQSLLVSLILWETPLPEPAGLMGLFAALATAQSLETRFPNLPPVQLKYPNDLMIHGRKLGGVLTELVDGVAIVGIGVNLEQTEFPAELQEKAISVRMAVRPHPPAPLSHGVGEGETLGEGTTAEFKRSAPSADFSILTPLSSLSVYGEGGLLAPRTHGSPSPFTERGLGGEVEKAGENATAAPEVAAEPYTLIPTEASSGSIRRRDADATHALRVASASRRRMEPLEASIDILPTIHHNLTCLLDLWRTCPEEVFRLWRARDCSAGRAYRVLDLPDQPVGVVLGVAPDFRLRLRLPDGAEHATYYVSAV